MAEKYKKLFMLDGVTYSLTEGNKAVNIHSEDDSYELSIEFFRGLQLLMIDIPFFWENANTLGEPRKMTSLLTMEFIADPKVVAEIDGVGLKKPTEGKDVFVLKFKDTEKERRITSEIFLYLFVLTEEIIQGKLDLVTK